MADYRQELSAKLEAAKKRVRQGRQVKGLKIVAPEFFEIIDIEISLVLNKAFDEKPLPYDEYLSAHGEMRGMKRIRDILNARETQEPSAAAEVDAIRENLESIDGKK